MFEPRGVRRKAVLRVLLAMGVAATCRDARSQVTIAGTISPLTGSPIIIGANLGTINGNNLFHTFSSFNLGQGDIATFQGPANIQNIIGRITGGVSTIDGKIQSEIQNANLFLINPSGIIFGRNASLNVSGSFHASTADYLLFSDGSRYYASGNNDGVFTAAPEAFGFLSPHPAGIAVQQSSLGVGSGKAITLSAGSLDISGSGGVTLVAPSGRIGLTAVSGPAEVPIAGSSTDAMAGTGGLVTLTHGASLSVTDGAAAAGSVRIQGGHLVMDQGSSIDATNRGDGKGGGVSISLGDGLELKNGSSIDVTNHGSGSGGDLSIRSAGAVALSEDSALWASTDGKGDSGMLSINAQSLQLSGSSQITSSTSGSGKALGIDIQATDLKVLQDAQITATTSNVGSAGLVRINAGSIQVDGTGGQSHFARIQSTSTGAGSTDGIGIDASTLAMQSGGEVVAESDASGGTGPVQINATRSITVSGSPRIPCPECDGGSYAQTSAIASYGYGTGSTGALTINTDALKLNEAGAIESKATGSKAPDITINAGTIMLQGQTGVRDNDTHIGTGTLGDYPGGDIVINATGSITIQGTAIVPRFFGAGTEKIYPLPDGIFSDTYGSGQAGSILITSPAMTLTGGGMVRAGSGSNNYTDTRVTGNSGKISLHVDDLRIEDGARVETTSVTSGDAGDIEINSRSILVTGTGTVNDGTVLPSGIFSDALQGGHGGKVTATADSIVVRDGGAITAESRGTGDAGQIRLNVGSSLLVENAGIMTSSLETGGGAISINPSGPGPVQVHLVNGTIATSVAAGQGNAGDIQLGKPGVPMPYLIVDRSQIRANAAAGAGGHINIDAGVFLGTPESVVSASAGNGGIPGVVDIQSAVSQLSQNFLPLLTSPLPKLSLVRCGGAERSTLTTVWPAPPKTLFPLLAREPSASLADSPCPISAAASAAGTR